MFGLVVYAVLSTAPGDLLLQSEPFPVWVVFVGLPVFCWVFWRILQEPSRLGTVWEPLCLALGQRVTS